MRSDMKFSLQDYQQEQNFSLVYRAEDYAFDIEPLYGAGDASIMVNQLQLEIDHEGLVMYAWGYCPLLKYEETIETPKNYTKQNLVAILKAPPIFGISYQLNKDVRWPVYINKKNWLGMYRRSPNSRKKISRVCPSLCCCVRRTRTRCCLAATKNLTN
ncbi:MAG: hypothetical protein JSR76_01515 [Verrucomicrobia bacterium]|nr:hypothetical protein [Verrucomicrobiota bacterium]